MSASLVPLPTNLSTTERHVGIDAGLAVQRAGAWSPHAEWLVQHLLDGFATLTGNNRFRQPSGALPLQIRLHTASAGAPQLHDDESYRLSVGPEGISVDAARTSGLARASATLLQLLKTGPNGFVLQAVEISDAPRWPWRGLMLDVARHFIEVDALRRTLHAMALFKLNVLHLHLSDDQAFRFECHHEPRLTAGGSDGRFYRQTELRSLVSLATHLGIRVVPELDMPGHVSSWLVACPELAADAAPRELPAAFGVHRAALDPTQENTYTFIEHLLDEVCAVFPDHTIHIGGDEVHPKAWSSAHIQRFMLDHHIDGVRDLQAHFNRRVGAMLTARGRQPMAWDEVLHPDLPDAFVVQAWRGAASIGAACASGQPVVASAGLYLDLGADAHAHHTFDAALDTAQLQRQEDTAVHSWRMRPVRAAYEAFLRVTRASLPPGSDTRANLLGAEACLWSELVTTELLDVRLWTRLPAVADMLWSGVAADTADLSVRLQTAVERLEQLGHARPRGAQAQLLLRHGCHQPEEVRPLLEALAPLPWYGRHLGERVLADRAAGAFDATDASDVRRPYRTDTPLNRIVDLLSPDAAACRQHITHIDDAQYRRQLANSWRAQLPAVERLAEQSAAFAEVLPMAKRLAELADWLERLAAPAAEDVSNWGTWRDATRGHVAETQLVALDIVDALVALPR